MEFETGLISSCQADLVVSGWVVTMFVDPLNLLAKTVALSFILVGLHSHPLLAGSVVDLRHNHPLGAILPGKTSEQAYFSLGNGRALKVDISRVLDETGSIKLEELSHEQPGNLPKKRFIKKRNLRW